MRFRKALKRGWRLALPLAGMQLGYQLLSVVDVAVLGHYDSAALAGVGIATSVLNAFLWLGTGVIMGLDTLIPQAAGANNDSQGRLLFDTGLRLCLLVAIPVTLATATIPTLLELAGVAPEATAFAAPYIWARLPSLAPHLIFAAQRSYLQSYENTRPLVIAMIAGNIVNLFADWLFVFGDPGLVRLGLPPIGFPELGVTGAGLATSLVSLTSMAVGFYYTRPKSKRARTWDFELARRTVKLGLPVGLQLLAEVGIFALAAVLAGRISDFAAATHMVALTMASTSFSAALGISAATSVAVGRDIGALDTPQARAAGWAGVFMGVVLMGVAGLFFFLFPFELGALFTSDPEVAQAAVPLIRIAAVFALSDAIQVAATGALRGAGDTTATFVGNAIGHYLIGLPIAVFLAFHLNMGPAGLWWGLTAGLTLVAVVLIARFDRLTRNPISPQLPLES